MRRISEHASWFSLRKAPKYVYLDCRWWLLYSTTDMAIRSVDGIACDAPRYNIAGDYRIFPTINLLDRSNYRQFRNERNFDQSIIVCLPTSDTDDTVWHNGASHPCLPMLNKDEMITGVVLYRLEDTHHVYLILCNFVLLPESFCSYASARC